MQSEKRQMIILKKLMRRREREAEFCMKQMRVRNKIWWIIMIYIRTTIYFHLIYIIMIVI